MRRHFGFSVLAGVLVAIAVAALSLFVVGCAKDDDDEDDDAAIITYKCDKKAIAQAAFATDEVLNAAFDVTDAAVLAKLGADAKVGRSMSFFKDSTWKIHSKYTFDYDGTPSYIIADYSGTYYGEPGFATKKGSIVVLPTYKTYKVVINTGNKIVSETNSFTQVTLQKTSTASELAIDDLIFATNKLTCELVIEGQTEE